MSAGGAAGSYWEDEAWEEEEWDESEGAEPATHGPDPDPIHALQRGLPLGLLAMGPMLFAYELALVSAGGGAHNTSELVLFRLFAPLGRYADAARWSVLGAAMVASLVYCLRRHWALGPRLFRIAAEGVLAAVLLGPLLVGLTLLIGDPASAMPLGGDPSAAPDLISAGLVFGGGAYEEIVFRLGLYSALYVVIAASTRFLGGGEWLARALAEVGGLVGQALLFSSFHLAVFVSWLGEGGEGFDSTTFLYRTFAGLALGLLFRLRGPGVCAWAHGSFNLALLLGAGPDVFL